MEMHTKAPRKGGQPIRKQEPSYLYPPEVAVGAQRRKLNPKGVLRT